MKSLQELALSYMSQYVVISSQGSAKIKPSLFNHRTSDANSRIMAFCAMAFVEERTMQQERNITDDS